MKAFVCRCEDVPLSEIEEAIAHGYDDLESLRRYTAVGTGPCQGKACLAECARLLAAKTGVPESALGLWTMRPPLVPIPLGFLAQLTDGLVEGLVEGSSVSVARDDPPDADDAEVWQKKGGRL